MSALVDEFNREKAKWDEGVKMQREARERMGEITNELGRELSGLVPGDIVAVEGGNRYELVHVYAREHNDGTGRLVWQLSLTGWRISKAGKKIGKSPHGIYGKWEKEQAPDGNEPAKTTVH